jgi:predicted nucleic acid-binding protein
VTPTHLLDTGWMIRHFRGEKRYTRTIQQIGAPHLAVSLISVAELHEGVFRASDSLLAETTLLTFLSDKTILPLTPDICRLFGQHRAQLRRQNRLIGDFDLLIAATCLSAGLTLLTTNLRHFQYIPGLTVISKPLPVL